ncbi:MAG: acetyl-CoA carboxylase carboxyltransferase subunit beta [bacterium]|nr:acetyl-CoA carboxylase carboxyltransferase subunit beta [bacterium]
MSWLRRDKKGLKGKSRAERREIPDGLWVKCQSCGEILYRQELEKNLWVCSGCRFHFRVGAHEYLDFMLDEGTFEERHSGLTSLDPLKFKADRTSYSDQLQRAKTKSSLEDAVICGFGLINGQPVSVAVMDFAFMGGSMGSVVGEKIARAIRDSLETRRPLIIVCSSGGARMQESILSLMQMAKTSALLGRMRERGIPFISLLTHPTTGGVTASFAMLGDVILAEPRALIGFAGRRVIKSTINSDLPDDFQLAEFLVEHGMVDRVVARHDLRKVLSHVLRFCTASNMEFLDNGERKSEDDTTTTALFDGRIVTADEDPVDVEPIQDDASA